jgi:hypothetical protein
VGAQTIQFDKTTAVEKNVQALARQKFSLFMLAPGALFTSASFGLLIQLTKFLEIIVDGHLETFLSRAKSAGGGIHELEHNNKSA